MKILKAAKDRPPRLSRQHLRDRQWVSDHIQELIDTSALCPLLFQQCHAPRLRKENFAVSTFHDDLI